MLSPRYALYSAQARPPLNYNSHPTKDHSFCSETMQIRLSSSFFLISTLFFLNGFAFVASSSVKTRFYTTPLQGIKGQTLSHDRRSTVPVSVVHQQHISRALHRLSLAIGRVPPSNEQLRTKIQEKIPAEVSQHNEKRLNRIGVPGLFRTPTATSKDAAKGIVHLGEYIGGFEDDDSGHSTQLFIE
ncbi:hypothetical protein L218DRAFT_77923 [Marasmius fiardii PR-910]|nr:hypothetical protein L218DRAFT_77923 [Marasmius fiardii PR-910]